MNKPVTILFLLKRIDCIDGVAVYCETLFAGLRARGDRVIIVSGEVTAPAEAEGRRAAIAAAAAEWIVMKEIDRAIPTANCIRRLLAIMREHEVDVISPQGLSMLPAASILSRLSGRPSVANYHPTVHGHLVDGMAQGPSVGRRLRYRLIATLFRPARFIALSKEIVDFYRDVCGVAARRIAHIPIGVDTGYYRPPTAEERSRARAAFGLDDDMLVCVLSGRLNLNKGHDVVVAAIRALRATKPGLRVVCLFPGLGSQRERIEAEALRDAADREAFRFLGYVSTEALRDAYRAADIALLPSRSEGFGIAIAEAMVSGCIPIRTPSGGARDQIVEGQTGYIVPFNDAGALAERIAGLADPERRRAMRARVLAHARANFDKNVMAAATSDLYRTVAARAAHAPASRPMAGAARPSPAEPLLIHHDMGPQPHGAGRATAAAVELQQPRGSSATADRVTP